MSAADAVAPGIYPAMDAATYYATQALSCSILRRFAQAPAKAHVLPPQTEAMEAGTVLHAAVLEAWTFEDRYAVTDLDRRGTRAWQEAEAEAMQAGRRLLKREAWERAQRVRDAVLSHPVARELLAPGIMTEAAVFWQDAETRLPCRARMDGIRHDMRVVVDVKTTTDASPWEFSRAAARLRLHWQRAFYGMGIAAAPGGFVPDGFVFLAVERDPPHLVAAYEIASADAEAGMAQVREAMRRYAECRASGYWPGYHEHIQELHLPAWATMTAEEAAPA